MVTNSGSHSGTNSVSHSGSSGTNSGIKTLKQIPSRASLLSISSSAMNLHQEFAAEISSSNSSSSSNSIDSQYDDISLEGVCLADEMKHTLNTSTTSNNTNNTTSSMHSNNTSVSSDGEFILGYSSNHIDHTSTHNQRLHPTQEQQQKTKPKPVRSNMLLNTLSSRNSIFSTPTSPSPRHTNLIKPVQLTKPIKPIKAVKKAAPLTSKISAPTKPTKPIHTIKSNTNSKPTNTNTNTYSTYVTVTKT